MIEIDGSYGQGGGQILRLSFALGVIFNKPVKVINLLTNRKTTGLKPQHFTSIKLIADISGWNIKGEIGSTECEIYPKEQEQEQEQEKKIIVADTKTAGSITLMLQAILPILLFKENNIEKIELRGGTDVPFSPPSRFFTNVFLPILMSKFEINKNVNFNIIRHGYYPIGKGIATIEVKNNCICPKCGYKNDKYIDMFENTTYDKETINGIIYGNADIEILKDIKEKLYNKLSEFNWNIVKDINLSIEKTGNSKKRNQTCGIFLTYYDECGYEMDENMNIYPLSGSSIGLLRKTTKEELIDDAVSELKREMSTGAGLDEYMADQLVIYMAICSKSMNSFIVPIQKNCTSLHLETAIEITNKFLDGKKIMLNDKKYSNCRILYVN